MPRLSRRAAAAVVALLSLAPTSAALAQGTNWPEKPIKLIVPFPPGGGSDVLGRLLAQEMSKGLKQAVVVDNKGGAAGSIGADAVAKAPPDGYTLLMVVRDMGINPATMKSLPYDTLRSFAWIGKAAVGHYVLVANPKFEAKTLADLVRLAKAKPGAISYGSLGIGSLGHINLETTFKQLGIDLLHVPYRGAGPALQAAVSGEVPVTLAAFTGSIPFIRDGRLVGLAVGSEKRAAQLPDVPTMVEAGGPAGTLLSTHWGFAAPAGTPRPIIDRVNAELRRALAEPEIVEKIVQNGLEPDFSSPEALGELVAKDIEHFAKLVKAIGIQQQ